MMFTQLRTTYYFLVILVLFFSLPSNAFVSSDKVGITAGEFRVNEQGAATYSIPLALPGGTAGVTPQISLNYSSQGGDGPMGIGWSLSAGGAISRCPKNMAQDNAISGISFTNTDPFCLNGQRLVLKSGTHGKSGAIYHTEIESFSKVTSYGNATSAGPLGFTVETKSGETHYYGYVNVVSGDKAISLKNYQGALEKGADAFIEPSGKTNKSVAKLYYLKAIKDMSGNTILFEYNENNGNTSIQRVSYGGNSKISQAPYATVNLNYQTKANFAKKSGFMNGTAYLRDKLLSNIQVELQGQETRKYTISYDTPIASEENYMLKSISECVESECYPATSFTWEKPVPASQSTQEFCEYEPGTQTYCHDEVVTTGFKPFGNKSGKLRSAPAPYTSRAIDMNADGFSDLVYLESGYWKIAYGPTFLNTRSLTSIGKSNSENLLTIDYNGDGRRDLLVANSASSTWSIVSFENYSERVRICEPGGGGGFIQRRGGELCYYETITKDLKVASIGKTAIGYDGKAQVLDINGDGLEDIVFQQGSYIKWYKNNGGTFSAAATLTSFSSSNTGTRLNGSIDKHTANMKNAAGIDVNGDGRSDLILKVTDTVTSCTMNGRQIPAGSRGECEQDIGGTWSSSSTTGWKLYTSTGTSLTKAQSLGNYESVRVADLNGDGLTDLLQYSSSSKWSYRLSNGQLFLPTKSLTMGSTTDTYKDNSYFIDLNKDGAADFLKATSNTSWTIFVSEYKNSEEIKYISRGTLTKKSGAVVQFGDANGDGKLDMFEGKDDSHGWRISYAPKSGKPDFVIKKITNGFGMDTDISYRPMTDKNVYVFEDSDDNVDIKTFSPMSGMNLVSSVKSDSGVSTAVEVQYQYGGFLVHRQGRGILGFEQVRTIDPSTGIETETIYDQTWPFIGMPLRTRQFTNDNKVLSDATNVLKTRSTYYGGIMAYIESSSEKSYSIGSDAQEYELNRTNSSFTYDAYGNLTNSVVTVSDLYGNDNQTTSTVNLYGSSSWEREKGRLSESTVNKTRNNTGQLSRTSLFFYFSRYDGNSPGMLKSSTLFSGTNKELRTEYEYDHFGNKIKVSKIGAENGDGSNVQTRSSTSSYGSNGRLVDFSLNAAGVRTDYRYNGSYAGTVSGRIIRTTSITNGLSYTKQFNQLGQVQSKSAPGVSSIYTYREYCGQVSCDNYGAYYRIRVVQNGMPEKRSYFNFLGKELESRVKNFGGGWTKLFRTYDAKGRGFRVYEPTNGSYGLYYSQPTYDSFNRIKQVRKPNGAITKTEFYGLKTVSIDAKGNQTESLKNPQGELVEVTDAIGSKLRYEYDSYGNLKNVIRVNRSGVHSTSVTNYYDSFGSKIRMIDQDKGDGNYQYNAFGELVQQKTARGHFSYLDYDNAGRLIRRYENEGTSCWNYNSSTGRLENEKFFKSSSKSLSQCRSDNTATHQKNVFYDQYGRADQSNTVIRDINGYVNDTYTTKSTFNSFGQIKSVEYPNNLSITNTYQNGYLKQLKNTNTGRPYQTINAMNHYGQVSNVQYANGAKEIISYIKEDGKVARHQMSVSGSLKHDLSYEYDLNNNLDWRKHYFSDKGYTKWEEALTYDKVNRLDYRNVTIHDNSYLSSGFKSDQNYNYDDWGNITFKTGTGTYNYDSTKKNRLKSISGSKNYSMSYDSSGNITNDGSGRSISYFTFDKVNRITKGSVYSEFLYGASRSRFYKHDRRTENSKTTDYYTAYVGGYEKIHRTGGGKSVLTEHKVNLGNVVITERSNGTNEENYLHKDHLGSPISITDKNGSVVQQFTYDPWGKQTKIYQTSTIADLIYSQPTNRGYTGHEHIGGLDIVHMNGRIYDANIGRFMQADPNIQSPANLQNYNRYSYVLNNPLSMTDPSGFFFKSLIKFVKKHWKAIVAIVVTYITAGAASGWAASWGFAAGTLGNAVVAGAIAGAAGGFTGGALMTGSLRGALRGALAGSIAGAAGGYANFGSVGGWGDAGKRIAMAAAGGCGAGKVSGGSCSKGARMAALAQAVSIGIEKFSKKPTLKTPDDKNGVYKLSEDKVGNQVHCVECDVTNTNVNNIGIGIRSEGANQIVGAPTPDSGWLSFNEGSAASRGLAHIPGFNSGAVFHDTLVGTLERSMGMQHWSSTAQAIGGIFTNQMTILPAIALNYYASGVHSYDYYWDNIGEQ